MTTESKKRPQDERELWVPVVGLNYYPKGAPEVLEGFVPNHPIDDPSLERMRMDYYQQGLEDGGPDKPKVVEVEPNSKPLKDEEPQQESEKKEADKPLVEGKDYKLTGKSSPK